MVVQCGAVLIHPNWVLTAAHCIRYNGNYLRQITAFFGEHRLTDRLTQSNTLSNDLDINLWPTKWSDNKSLIVTRNVSKAIVNDNFNEKTFESDIALIGVNPSVNIQPICLPTYQQDFSGQTGYISGFGVLEWESTRVPSVLQIASVPIMTTDLCRYMFEQLGYDNVIKVGKLCAGTVDGGRDACAGDSGGPLAVRRSDTNKWVLVGIISNGLKCGRPNTPGLYTNVSEFVHWINDVIDKQTMYL